ncbi:MAG TPA: hypothetical protein VMR59_04615 [Patescibacteria group bacterium]|jgi:hypothetical protein|nr:hypothetical protein [Patescibacteria group bacterium]
MDERKGRLEFNVITYCTEEVQRVFDRTDADRRELGTQYASEIARFADLMCSQGIFPSANVVNTWSMVNLLNAYHQEALLRIGVLDDKTGIFVTSDGKVEKRTERMISFRGFSGILIDNVGQEMNGEDLLTWGPKALGAIAEVFRSSQDAPQQQVTS